jgi:hypothetical protein
MKKIINGIFRATQGLVEFGAFYLFLMMFADFLDKMGRE